MANKGTPGGKLGPAKASSRRARGKSSQITCRIHKKVKGWADGVLRAFGRLDAVDTGNGLAVPRIMGLTPPKTETRNYRKHLCQEKNTFAERVRKNSASTNTLKSPRRNQVATANAPRKLPHAQ